MPTQEQLARAYAAANPTRDGGTWSGWCASLMYRYNGATVAYENATAAGDAVQLNGDVTAAPIGAVHYWAGANGDGHTAQDMAGSGAKLFMASNRVTEPLGDAIGFISFDDYQAKTGLPYRGWAMSYGVNPIVQADDNGTHGVTPPAPSGELRQVQGDGVTYSEPIGALAQRIGAALEARGRVDQPFSNDGDPGANWRKGVQRTLVNAGLWAGEPDGLLGVNNLKGVQEYAKKFGDYTFVIDGDPQINSWSNFALGLERP